MLKAVFFDVDFTLFRPGPELGPEGYRRLGERHGLALDPGRYGMPRAAAIETLQRNHELVHDEEIWIAFTEQIVLGMGGEPSGARECATDMVREWERHENFSLYEDALPVLEELRRHELRIGLDLERPARSRGVRRASRRSRSTPMVGSRAHGRVKPHASIFVAALQALGVEPDETAMVGDSYEDDIEGARALGIRAILLDRDGLRPDDARPDRHVARAAGGARAAASADLRPELAPPRFRVRAERHRSGGRLDPNAAALPRASRRGRRRRPRRRSARATPRADA